MTADPSIVDAISEGLKVDACHLVGAAMVEVAPSRRNDRGWPIWMVAARIEGPEFTGHEVGIWATHDAARIGPIFAINETARDLTSWGEAAMPGSQADRNMRLMDTYPEAAVAERAARQ